jgi:uncharacterized membrane protein YfcA
VLHAINPLYSLSGLGVGLLVGFTGVGGGSLMTPLLVMVFGIHPATAVGTDLLYAGLTKISGSAIHSYNGAIDWKVVRRLALGSAPAATLTLIALSVLGQRSNMASHVITTTLGFALLMTAVTLLFRKWLIGRYGAKLEGASERQISAMTTGLGIILGVTALLMLYPKMPTVRLVGSDIAHAVPLTLIAGAGHWWMGSVNFALLFSLLIGSIPGIMVGSYFASRVPDRVLRPLLAGTLALIGVRMAF